MGSVAKQRPHFKPYLSSISISGQPAKFGRCSDTDHVLHSIMTSKRTRLWNAGSSATYWKDTDAAVRRATAAKYGEHTAREIETLWPGLEDEERALLELMLLTGRRSLVAAYEDELCNALVAKQLLQIPAGVGTLLMQDLDTTFKIPRAVWRVLNERKEHFVPCRESEAGEHLARLTHRLGSRLRGPFHQ